MESSDIWGGEQMMEWQEVTLRSRQAVHLASVAVMALGVLGTWVLL